jgi:endonuclease YncB( thermonuclease family)
MVSGIVAAGFACIYFDERFGRPAMPPVEFPSLPISTASPILDDVRPGSFALCAGPVRANCVVDGDTFWFRGEKIRVADIDAPELSEPACPAERQARGMSRDRLLQMLNEGRFQLTSGWRDEDRFGRKLRMVSRSGRSLGDRLAEERLARRWDGPDFGWCDGAVGAVR